MQTMRSALVLLAPRRDKLTLFIEHDHRVGTLARRVHCVVDIDVTLGIPDDSMSVPVFNSGRQITPVVDGLILEIALPEYGQPGAGLILRAQDNRAGRC